MWRLSFVIVLAAAARGSPRHGARSLRHGARLSGRRRVHLHHRTRHHVTSTPASTSTSTPASSSTTLPAGSISHPTGASTWSCACPPAVGSCPSSTTTRRSRSSRCMVTAASSCPGPPPCSIRARLCRTYRPQRRLRGRHPGDPRRRQGSRTLPERRRLRPAGSDRRGHHHHHHQRRRHHLQLRHLRARLRQRRRQWPHHAATAGTGRRQRPAHQAERPQQLLGSAARLGGLRFHRAQRVQPGHRHHRGDGLHRRQAQPSPLAAGRPGHGGTAVPNAQGLRQLVVSGDDLATLKPLLQQATQITIWESGTAKYDLWFRPLLPDEAAAL